MCGLGSESIMVHLDIQLTQHYLLEKNYLYNQNRSAYWPLLLTKLPSTNYYSLVATTPSSPAINFCQNQLWLHRFFLLSIFCSQFYWFYSLLLFLCCFFVLNFLPPLFHVFRGDSRGHWSETFLLFQNRLLILSISF